MNLTWLRILRNFKVQTNSQKVQRNFEKTNAEFTDFFLEKIKLSETTTSQIEKKKILQITFIATLPFLQQPDVYQHWKSTSINMYTQWKIHSRMHQDKRSCTTNKSKRKKDRERWREIERGREMKRNTLATLCGAEFKPQAHCLNFSTDQNPNSNLKLQLGRACGRTTYSASVKNCSCLSSETCHVRVQRGRGKQLEKRWGNVAKAQKKLWCWPQDRQIIKKVNRNGHTLISKAKKL